MAVFLHFLHYLTLIKYNYDHSSGSLFELGSHVTVWSIAHYSWNQCSAKLFDFDRAMAPCWPSKCITSYKQITETPTSWRTQIHKERVLADVRWLTRREYEFSVNGSPRDCGAAVAWIKRRFCAASISTKPVYQQILSIVHQKDDRQTSLTHKRGCKSSVDLYAPKTLTLSISWKINGK